MINRILFSFLDIFRPRIGYPPGKLSQRMFGPKTVPTFPQKWVPERCHFDFYLPPAELTLHQKSNIGKCD
jgi:hypothetical protein